MRRLHRLVLSCLVLGGACRAHADSFEPNDTLETAFGPLQSGVTYESVISQDDPADWFFLELDPGNLSLALTDLPSNTDYDLFVWDEYGILAASQQDSALDESIEMLFTQGRRLWIQIEPVSGHSSSDSYRLTATFTAPNQPPLVKLLSPNGGEQFEIEDSVTVLYSYGDAETPDSLIAAVFLSVDNGGSWTELESGPATGAARVPLPLHPSDQARFRVDLSDPGNQTARDTSDAAFLIELPPPQASWIEAGADSGEYLSPVTLPLHVSGTPAAVRMFLTLPGLSSGLSLNQVTLTDRCPSCELSTDVSDSLLEITVAAPEGDVVPASESPLAVVQATLEAVPGTGFEVRVDSAQVHDLWGRQLNTEFAHGWVRVTGTLPEVVLSIPETTADLGASIQVPVTLETTAALDSLHLSLTVDRDVLGWQGVSLNPTLGVWDVSQRAQADTTWLAFLGGRLPGLSDTLCRLHLHALEKGEALLQWLDARAWGPGGVSLPVRTVDSRVTPVVLTAFFVQGTPQGAELAWILESDESVAVRISRGNEPITSWFFPEHPRYVDANTEPGKSYTYQVAFRTRTGDVTLSPRREATLPAGFTLAAPYPNPSSQGFQAAFRGGVKKAQVYDHQGRLVRELELESHTHGTLRWDGRDQQGESASSGVYFLRVAPQDGKPVTRRIVRVP